MRKSLVIDVFGLVQGVFFRAGVRREAGKLGVSGWAANMPDGSVRIEAEGNEDALEKLVEWCRQGPPKARVDKVEYKMKDDHRNFSGFEIR